MLNGVTRACFSMRWSILNRRPQRLNEGGRMAVRRLPIVASAAPGHRQLDGLEVAQRLHPPVPREPGTGNQPTLKLAIRRLSN